MADEEIISEDHNHSDTELSHAARELVLHGDNTQHLYHTSTVPIRKNLNKKIAKGVYDHDKAAKLWGYHADKAAQSYAREHGHPGVKWHEMFKPKDRRAAAKHWADEHHASIMSGSQDHVHEDTSASDIVLAALEAKPVDLNTTFHAAVLERSQFVVREMKDALAQTVFAEKEEELDEVSTKTLDPYINRTRDDPKRKKGLYLALQKKWGDPTYGFDAAKVPASDVPAAKTVARMKKETK